MHKTLCFSRVIFLVKKILGGRVAESVDRDIRKICVLKNNGNAIGPVSEPK